MFMPENEKPTPTEAEAIQSDELRVIRESVEGTAEGPKKIQSIIDTVLAPSIDRIKDIDLKGLTPDEQALVIQQLQRIDQKLKLVREMAAGHSQKIEGQRETLDRLESLIKSREEEFARIGEESARQVQLAHKINGKPNTTPKTAEKSPEVVSGSVKVPNTNPPSKLSIYNKDRQLIGSFTIVGNGQVSQWDLLLNGRDYGQAVWNGREWDCSIDAAFSAYAQVNGGALIAVAAPAATPVVKPDVQPIQPKSQAEPVKPKDPTPKEPVKEPTPTPKSSPSKPEVVQPPQTPEKQPEETLPRMKFPERIADSAKPTIANDQVSYDKWDNEWLLDTNENSVFSRIAKRYKQLKSIKDAHPDNTLAQESYETVIALVRTFDVVIEKGGDSVDFQNMRDTEQVLMQLDQALYELEAASAKKKARKTPYVSPYDSEDEFSSLLKRKKFDDIVDSYIEEPTAGSPSRGVSDTKITPGSKERQNESVESSRIVSVPRNAPFQIEVRDEQTRTTHTLHTITQNTTRATHGPVQIVASPTEWTLSVPAEFRGAMRIIQNGVENVYAYGINGTSTQVEKPAVATVKPTTTREAPATVKPATPERQVAQPTLSRSSIAEYFQQPGGLNRLEARLSQAMQKYEVVKKDQERFGGRIEWQTYMQEARQLYVMYRLALPNGGWPTDQNNQIALLSATEQFEQVLQDYGTESATWTENPPGKEDPVWSDAGEKLSWQDRVTRAATTYSKLQDEYGSVQDESFKEVYIKFKATMKQYSDVYLEQTKVVPRDERAVTATVSQMERLLHYYTTKLAEEKTKAESNATPTATPSGLMGLFSNATAAVGKAVKQGAEDPELQKKMLEGMFKPGQSRFEIRQSLIYGSGLKPFPKLSNQEVQSLLYLKAHLKDFAGLDGRLNAGDMTAVVDRIYQDVMSRPRDLHQRILKEKNIQQGSFQDVGLQKALGLVAVMTAEESSQYNQGLNAESRPLMRFFFKAFRGADYNKLQNAKAQLGQLYAVRAQIPLEVRQNVDKELRAFLTKAHIPPTVNQRDSGHGNLTEFDMREFERHAAILKEISRRSLKDVVDRTGASIETYMPDGLSVEFIDWILDSHARPEGRKGSAPGSSFWIENAPVSTAAERAKRNGTPVDNRNTAQTDAPEVQLGEPEVQLGEPEATLGTPEPLQ